MSAPFRIHLTIARGGTDVFAGETSTAELTRELTDLTEHLVRALSLPDGAVLLTGTGIVPAAPFTLLPGDTVRIEIDGLGVLQNPVLEVGRPGS